MLFGAEVRSHEGAGRATVTKTRGEKLREGNEAQESIDPSGLRSGWVRIFAGSKALELRGIVTSWSSEQDDAMSETA
jgi:hypothetical protein